MESCAEQGPIIFFANNLTRVANGEEAATTKQQVGPRDEPVVRFVTAGTNPKPAWPTIGEARAADDMVERLVQFAGEALEKHGVLPPLVRAFVAGGRMAVSSMTVQEVQVAFTEVVGAHLGKITGFFINKSQQDREREAAGDHAGEALTKVLQVIEDGRFPYNPVAYIFQTARNYWVDVLRKKERKELQLDKDMMSGVPDRGSRPEDELVQNEACQNILSGLDSDTKNILDLREDYTGQQIADRLQLPLKEVLKKVRQVQRREWKKLVRTLHREGRNVQAIAEEILRRQGYTRYNDYTEDQIAKELKQTMNKVRKELNKRQSRKDRP